jgi:hypothetical protein
VAIATLQQMGLRPSAHLPDQAYGINGHEWGAKIILCAGSRAAEASTLMECPLADARGSETEP